MTKITDTQIREALHKKKFARAAQSQKTLVVDELGLMHARARVDVAVINGCVHGYEIKSEADTLKRFDRQLAIYSTCLEKLTVVCAEKHLTELYSLTPKWCGILLVTKGPRSGLDFITVRRPNRNPGLDKIKLAHLLWRPEVIELLTQLGAPSVLLKKSRVDMYDFVADRLSAAQITDYVRSCFISRETWRRPPKHA
ncbi:MAG TPA: sce7726 family protein [Rhizomicrobium sp.]|jgi:hypothetical protein